MTAIVSSNFRVVNAANFENDVKSSNVYVAIGKSDAWSNSTSDITDTTPFTPNDHIDDLAEARRNILGYKKITSANVSHVIPRHNWENGSVYEAWDSNDGAIFDKKFYIVTSEFKVYKCIISPGTASNVMPVQTLTQPQSEGDGYTWKYMYTITTAQSEAFLTNAFMPVKTIPLSVTGKVANSGGAGTSFILSESNPDISVGHTVSGTGISGTPKVTAILGSKITVSTSQTVTAGTVLTFKFADGSSGNTDASNNLSEGDYAQYLNQKASFDDTKAAGIERFEVTNAGSGYTGTPTAAITGDGTGITSATIVKSGNTISAVNVTGTTKGTNYTIADVVISGGSGSNATARAVIAPKNGHGTDPVSELGGFFMALAVSLDGVANSDLTVGNDFRQVLLVKDPLLAAGAVATADSLKGLKSLSVTSTTGFQVDEVITGGTSSAKAFIAEIGSGASAGKIFYYQNRKTGFGIFQASENITGGTSSTTTAISSGGVNAAEADVSSGEALFLENRTPISRSATQIEDVKLILEF